MMKNEKLTEDERGECASLYAHVHHVRVYRDICVCYNMLCSLFYEWNSSSLPLALL